MDFSGEFLCCFIDKSIGIDPRNKQWNDNINDTKSLENSSNCSILPFGDKNNIIENSVSKGQISDQTSKPNENNNGHLQCIKRFNR